jgi:hypothetical protein
MSLAEAGACFADGALVGRWKSSKPRTPPLLHSHQQRVNFQTTRAAGHCWIQHSFTSFGHALLRIVASTLGPAPVIAQHDELLIHVPVRLDGEATVGYTGRYCR